MRTLIGFLLVIAVVVIFITVFNVPPVLASLIGGFSGAMYGVVTRMRKRSEG